MRKTFITWGLTITLAWSFSGCTTSHFNAARSEDDIVICRQFLATAGVRALELNRETFSPRDLTLQELILLTPRDHDFAAAQFLVLDKEWSFQTNGTKIVIICTQGQRDRSVKLKYFAGSNSGNCDFISEDELSGLVLSNYMILPKITYP